MDNNDSNVRRPPPPPLPLAMLGKSDSTIKAKTQTLFIGNKCRPKTTDIKDIDIGDILPTTNKAKQHKVYYSGNYEVVQSKGDQPVLDSHALESIRHGLMSNASVDFFLNHLVDKKDDIAIIPTEKFRAFIECTSDIDRLNKYNRFTRKMGKEILDYDVVCFANLSGAHYSLIVLVKLNRADSKYDLISKCSLGKPHTVLIEQFFRFIKAPFEQKYPTPIEDNFRIDPYKSRSSKQESTDICSGKQELLFLLPKTFVSLTQLSSLLLLMQRFYV